MNLIRKSLFKCYSQYKLFSAVSFENHKDRLVIIEIPGKNFPR